MLFGPLGYELSEACTNLMNEQTWFMMDLSMPHVLSSWPTEPQSINLILIFTVLTIANIKNLEIPLFLWMGLFIGRWNLTSFYNACYCKYLRVFRVIWYIYSWFQAMIKEAMQMQIHFIKHKTTCTNLRFILLSV